MNRDQLLAAVTDLVETYVDATIDRALQLALTTITDGAARRHDVRTNGQAAGSRAQRRSEVDSRAGNNDSATKPPRTGKARSRRKTRAIGSSSNVPATSTRSMQPSGVSGARAGEGPAAVHFSTTPATADAVPLTPTSPSVKPARSPASSPSSTESPPPMSFGHPPRDHVRTSKPRRRAFVSPHAPPPGWTPELDRREELLALSELTLRRKTGG